MNNKVKLGLLIKPATFIVFAILLELVNFLWIGFKVTGNQELLQVLPKYFLIDLSIICLIAGIMFVSNKVWSNILYYVFLGLQLAINMINATLYKVFGDIFSFDMMKLGGEALAAFKFEFIDFWNILANLAILAVIIVVQLLLDRKVKKEIKLKKMNRLAFALVMFFSLFTFSCVSFTAQILNFKDTKSSVAVAESDQYLWDNMHFKFEAYKKFGTYGFYLKSLSNMIYKDDHYDSQMQTDLLLDLKNGEQGVDVTADLYGDNLIVIMMESFEWFAIDPYNTPTLWDLKENSGVSLVNYHSKNKTNMSENICMLGNMPKDNSMNSLARNGLLNTKYSLPNMFNSLGYTSNYFHTYKKTFYNRDQVNVALGFDNVYGLEDAKLKNKSTKFNQWNLDSDYAQAMIEKMVPTDQKFFSFFTTVTTHGTYETTNERFKPYYKEYDQNFDSDGVLGTYATEFYKQKGIDLGTQGYKEWFDNNTNYVYPKEKDLQKCFRQYKCAAMDTDRLVAYLINYLEQNNLDNNTTILMYSDHNAYYHDLTNHVKNVAKEDYFDVYGYNVPCMIYSKKLGAQKNLDFVNTYDLYPTLCELFGLNYTKAMIQGYDIFSTDIENSVMVSYMSGAFNQDFYTLNIVDMFMTENATQANLEKFKRNACLFYEKQFRIELIYKYGLAL